MAMNIQFRGGPLAGRKFEFADDVETIEIGRDPDQCQVVLPADMTVVGRLHMTLRREAGRYRIAVNRDNAVYVDEELAVDGMELPETAVIRLGKDGPRFVANTKLSGAVPATDRRGGAGPGLRTRLRQSERTAKMNRKVMGIVTVVVVALGIGGWLLLKERPTKKDIKDTLEGIASDMSARLDGELKAHERELEALKGTLGEERKELAQLIVERDKRAALLEELRKRQDLDEAKRKKLESTFEQKLKDADKKLAKLNETIGEQAGKRSDWVALAAKYEPGLFIIVGETLLRDSSGKLRTDFLGKPRMANRGIGTAFCIRKDGLLATNAHVVMFLEKKWDSMMAYQSGTGRGFKIEKFARHKKWRESNIRGPDVGLIQLEDPQPGSSRSNDLPVLEIASTADLRKLRVGSEIGTIGFPGEFLEDYVAAGAPAKAKKTHATFKVGYVGRLTDYSSSRREFSAARYIQHSAQLTGGCSGSPLFTIDGKVVGVHHAMRTIVSLKPVKDAAGKIQLKPVQSASAAAIQFGVRIDELMEFWKSKGW